MFVMNESCFVSLIFSFYVCRTGVIVFSRKCLVWSRFVLKRFVDDWDYYLFGIWALFL